MGTLLLTQEEVKSLFTMKDVVDAVNKTYIRLGDGTTINPTKITLDLGESSPYPAYEGYMNAMPAYVGWKDIAGLKWAGGFSGERRKKGLPYVVYLTWFGWS